MDKAKTVKATFEKPKTTAGPDTIEVYGVEGREEAEDEPENGRISLGRDKSGETAAEED